MDSKQFDTITRHFASRRLSRRSAILAGTGVAALTLSGTSAQSTPEAVPDERIPFMFVQTFGQGSLSPGDEEGLLTLTADHLAGQTVFFSDRPERIVGMVPTERFLSAGPVDSSGFSRFDPPNAALVFSAADGNGDIAVLELIDPSYDAANGTVSYSVRLLENVESVDISLEQVPLAVDGAAREFDAASLFIDDCPDGQVVCLAGDGSGEIGQFPNGGGSMGFCYDAAQLCCLPCQSPPFDDSWASSCNQTFVSCQGNCGISYNGGWACN